MDQLDSYLDIGGFVRVVAKPGPHSMIMPTRVTSLYSTAFLAGWVLGDAGDARPVAKELREWLEPTPEGGRGWAAGGSDERPSTASGTQN